MISLDDRIGSGELEKYFVPYGIKVNKIRMGSSDIRWEGKGPHGDCLVGVERKRIDASSSDLVESIHTRRLSGSQLPALSDDLDYCYLILEGVWRRGADGHAEVSMGGGNWRPLGITSRAINNYVMGLSLRAGMIAWRTANPQETVAFVVDQYRMWTDKAWNEHTCHEAVYAPASGGRGRRMTFRPRKISLAEKVCMQLPGIDSKATVVARHFGSVERMMAASVKDWGEVKGIGKVGAKRIWEALRA